MALSVGYVTLGCKVSQYETEAVREQMEVRGYSTRPFEEPCDVYVVNTCTVTAESDRKCRQAIRRAHKANPDAPIFVMGCYAQSAPETVLALPGVVFVSGTAGKTALPDRIAEYFRTPHSAPVAPVCAVRPLTGEGFELMTVISAPRTRAYVKIEDGCECFCTYCAIPRARGEVRSKKPEDVLAEVEGLARRGTGEVVLTGIETASYGADLPDIRLIDLLERLEKESTVPRIRLGSLTPAVLTEDFVTRLRALKKPAPHFHLSIQSGSDGVLRRMARRYRAQEERDAIARLRAALPEAELTCDVMVGFPGETEEEFRETEAFCREADFLSMHVFAYSPRAGTAAARMKGQVPEPVKHARSAALIALAAEMRAGRLRRRLEAGAPLRVLFETEKDGYWEGHADAFLPVRVKAGAGEDLHGVFHTVLPEDSDDTWLYGRIL